MSSIICITVHIVHCTSIPSLIKNLSLDWVVLGPSGPHLAPFDVTFEYEFINFHLIFCRTFQGPGARPLIPQLKIVLSRCLLGPSFSECKSLHSLLLPFLCYFPCPFHFPAVKWPLKSISGVWVKAMTENTFYAFSA